MLGVGISVIMSLGRWILGVGLVVLVLVVVGWLFWKLLRPRLLRAIQAQTIQTLYGQTLGYPERLYPSASGDPVLGEAAAVQARIAQRIPALSDQARVQLLGSIWPQLRVMMDALYQEARLRPHASKTLEGELGRFHEIETAVMALGSRLAKTEQSVLHTTADAILQELDTLR